MEIKRHLAMVIVFMSMSMMVFAQQAPETSVTITGTPITTVKEGSPYSFTPTGAALNGDPFFYHIENKPTWAEFSSTTSVLKVRLPKSRSCALT